MKRIPFLRLDGKRFYEQMHLHIKQRADLLLLLYGGFIMYKKYIEQLEEAGKIRNLKDRSIHKL